MEDFKNYTKRQNINGGQQWEKSYEDGLTAWVMIYGRVTQEKIESAFFEQECNSDEFGRI